MPWLDDIDTTAPTDTEFVSEGAGRFRELKRALIERLATAFKGFPGENPDRPGEELLFPIASVRVGAEAERPAAPEREGAGWFSTNTGLLYIGNKDLEWQRLSMASIDAPLFPKFKAVKRTTFQEVPSDPPGAQIRFDNADIDYQDNGQFFSAAASQTDFVIPETGRYLVTATMRGSIVSGEPEMTSLVLTHNNVTVYQSIQAVPDWPSGITPTCNIATQLALSKDDTLSLWARPMFSSSVLRLIPASVLFEAVKLDLPLMQAVPPTPIPDDEEDEYDEYDEYL